MTRGARYAKSVRANYSLNESQEVILDLAAETLDTLDAEGLSLPERRQQKIILLRALSQLGLPDVDADPDPDAPRPAAEGGRARSTKARQAARARHGPAGGNH